MLSLLSIPSMVALVLGGVAAIGWLLRLVIRHQRELHERVEANWRAAAAQLGGEYVPQTGSWRRRTARRVDAVIAGRAVSLDTFVVSTGNTHVTYTRARVATTATRRLHVYGESFLSGVAKALGAQDVRVGDDAYDERFQIKSDDAEWARRVLAEPIREQHLEDGKLQLRVDKGWVETFAAGLEQDVETLVRRMRLTAALAFAVEP